MLFGKWDWLGCKHPNRLVLQATNRKQEQLIVHASVCVLVVAHVPEVSESADVLVLTGTPPVADVADIAETAIGIADATRQGGKSEFIRAITGFSIIIIPERR